MMKATRTTISTFSVITALAGLEHGIGEILQGNVAPDGIVISSWPESEFFRILAGEPAMTIIPNMLVTGFLTICFSLVFLVWATQFTQRKNSGLVLILLSFTLLLVGGGFGPPLLGIILGIAATRIQTRLAGQRSRFPSGTRGLLVQVWPWSLSASILAWLYLFPGSTILAYYLGVENPTLIGLAFFIAIGTLLLAIVSGFARDSQRQNVSDFGTISVGGK